MRVSQIAASRWMRKTNGVPGAAASSIHRPTECFVAEDSAAALASSPKRYIAGASASNAKLAISAMPATTYQAAHAFRILWAPFMFVSCLNHRVKCGPSLPGKSRGIS
jgi:hypothetical protein